MNEAFIDVATIEKELKKLWTEMSTQHSQKEAVIRACVHNLIVYAPGERSDAEVNSIVAEITVQNPGRVFILLPDTSIKEKKISAWVSAQCYRTSGMRQQVCCEQIMVRAHGESVQELPSILQPLMIPDLPVFVWWRAPVSNEKVFNDLLEFAARTIIDSAFQDSNQSIQEIIQTLVRNVPLCAVSDLNWARLTIWRELIARLFDAIDARPMLNEISRIEIASDNPLSLQPLFILSWLGCRLNWVLDSKIMKVRDHIHLRFADANNHNVDVVISSGARALESVKLVTESKVFSVSSTAEAFRSEVTSSGKVVFTQDKRLVPLTEADLLRKELQIVGRDVGYEQMIRFLESLF
jgi:glucose-6-phosphate dehydrogenase assembly protein OpcA